MHFINYISFANYYPYNNIKLDNYNIDTQDFRLKYQQKSALNFTHYLIIIYRN